MQLSMFSAEEPHVSPFRLRGCDKGWRTLAATSCSPLGLLLGDIGPTGWSGKTSPEFCRRTEDGILVPSSGCWGSSGMGSPTGFWTLNTSEHAASHKLSLSADVVCGLSAIVETGDVPQRYFLTAKACQGILRRAEKRDKALPEVLKLALQEVASRT